MILDNLAIPTAVMHSGDRVSDFFAECVRRDVPGLPFVSGQGEITGRISIRHIFKETCVPHWAIRAAHVLGDRIDAVNIPHVRARQILDEPVDHYVLPEFASSTSQSPIVKGLAIMEQVNSSYIFLIDDGRYAGIVTHMKIASRLMDRAGDVVL